MKPLKNIQCFIVVLFISGSLFSQSIDNKDTLKLLEQFNKQTQKWKEAYNSKDASNLIPLYTEDAQYVSSHVSGLVALGRNKLIANFQNGMNMGGHIDSIEILTMNVSCDLATLLCKYQASNNGETFIGRNLLVLKKINQMWLIIIHMTVI